MAAPGGPGNGPGQALAVQQGQYSHAGAIAILTRELPLEDVTKLLVLESAVQLVSPSTLFITVRGKFFLVCQFKPHDG